MNKKIAILGGGASGFFVGANLAPSFSVTIFEKAQNPLQKVKISGGGRCNVTNACFDPKDLVEFYPRGKKELLSVFHQFQPGDTFSWFEERGIPLKIENDNRVFPVSNNSADIVECLVKENQKNGVDIQLGNGILEIEKIEENFKIKTKNAEEVFDYLIIAAGSSKQVWEICKKLNHNIVEPVPSLFTFNIKDEKIKDLQGTSFPNAEVKILNTTLENSGSLLITHWGLSGPAVLVLSAWGARELHDLNYKFEIDVNFIGISTDEFYDELIQVKEEKSATNIGKFAPRNLTKRFWNQQLEMLKINPNKTWAETSHQQLKKITEMITQSRFSVNGKSTFKEEFVTAGGVELKEINFKNMESKIIPNLFFCGEILNIDAVTGGFNFQACWSEAWIIANYLNQQQ